MEDEDVCPSDNGAGHIDVLLYIKTGEYWDGWPLTGIPPRYVTSHLGQLSLLPSLG